MMSLSLKMITIDFNLDRDEFDKTKGTFLCMAKKVRVIRTSSPHAHVGRHTQYTNQEQYQKRLLQVNILYFSLCIVKRAG